MLTTLAVALALTSPLPPPRPAELQPPAALSPAQPAPQERPAAEIAPPSDAPTGADAAPERAPGPDPRSETALLVPFPPRRPRTAAEDSGARPPDPVTGSPLPVPPAAEVPAPRPDAAQPSAAALAEREPTAAYGEPVSAGMPLPPRRPARAQAAPPPASITAKDAAAPKNFAAAANAPEPALAEHTGEPVRGLPKRAPRPDDAPVLRAMLPNTEGQARPILPRDMVCRDPRLVGSRVASFAGGIPGCGIVDPVRVTSINGVGFSSPITVDCRTARKFADWLGGVAQPAAREVMGSGIKSLWVMGSYSCRTRNNQPGKRLSEHSVGRAVDVGGVTLADGRRIVVRDHWGKGAHGAFLRRIWKGACGGFTTVIGPDGDRYHRDHLHFDAAYRNDTWCR